MDYQAEAMGKSDRRDRDGKDGDDKKKMGGGFSRKKQCKFSADTEYVLDYKDVQMMKSFISEHGRIVPRRVSGTSAHWQRKLTTALKRARTLALIGYVDTGH